MNNQINRQINKVKLCRNFTSCKRYFLTCLILKKKSKELKKISNQKQAEEGIAEKKMSVLSSRLDQGFGQCRLLRADLCLHGLQRGMMSWLPQQQKYNHCLCFPIFQKNILISSSGRLNPKNFSRKDNSLRFLYIFKCKLSLILLRSKNFYFPTKLSFFEYFLIAKRPQNLEWKCNQHYSPLMSSVCVTCLWVVRAITPPHVKGITLHKDFHQLHCACLQNTCYTAEVRASHLRKESIIVVIKKFIES